MEIVLSTANPTKVIELVKNTPIKRLYFLDIELKTDESGLNLAMKIRDYDAEGMIVFITSHIELSHLSFEYKLSALDFIMKREFEGMKKRIADCLDTAFKRHSSPTIDNQKLKIKVNQKIEYYDFSDIIFFETHGDSKEVVLYTAYDRVQTNLTLKSIAAMDERLWRCHRSFLINRDYIKYVDYKEAKVFLKNGDSCDISRREMKKYKESYIKNSL